VSDIPRTARTKMICGQKRGLAAAWRGCCANSRRHFARLRRWSMTIVRTTLATTSIFTNPYDEGRDPRRCGVRLAFW